MSMNYLASVAFACAAYALLFAYGAVRGNVHMQEYIILSAAAAWVSCYSGYVVENVSTAWAVLLWSALVATAMGAALLMFMMALFS